MRLLLTFELYLQRAQAPPVFEALTCADEVELLTVMRERLSNPEILSIDAYRMGEHIATLAR
ncbi:MAG: hypothetical protein IT546_03055 [Caulobacteraceae bacterium]|nr:hypothetical protein [Caulobacteraceae bacterium]